MTDRMINKAWIQAKSEQLNIPYESVLAGYVMEELVCLLADSSYGSRFLLKNPHVLGLSAWEKGCHRNLCYFYVTDSEEALKKSELAVILKETVKWEKQTRINWSWHSEKSPQGIQVFMIAELDHMKVPLDLLIQSEGKTNEGLQPVIQNIHRITKNNFSCQIYVYPGERLLLENYQLIVEQLELIQKIEAYDQIYEILGEMKFEGRKIQTGINNIAKASKIGNQKERINTIAGYENYRTMEKKWNSYLKRERKTAPDWKEVLRRFLQFFTPLIDATAEDMIYLGDWMPELGRYLD